MLNKTVAVMVAALLGLSTVGHATRVQRLSLTEVRDQASWILVAVVSFEQTRLGPNAKMVWTDYDLEVEEVLQGDNQVDHKTVSFAGGEAEGRAAGITGVPRLEVGRRYVFFLMADGIPWPTPTVGWGQGIFEVVPERSRQEPEVLVSYDGEPLELTDNGLRRGGRVRRTEVWLKLPEARDPLRGSREAEPVVLNAEGKEIEQPLRAAEPKAVPLVDRPFATLHDLRRFVLGELQEDHGKPR